MKIVSFSFVGAVAKESLGAVLISLEEEVESGQLQSI